VPGHETTAAGGDRPLQTDVNVTLQRERAHQPEDLTRLFVERANEGDAEGMALLYEVDAIMAYPLGQQTVGRANIAGLFEKMVASRPHFGLEEPLPTLILGDLALTSTPALDAAGARAQVARRQPDGTWLRVLDRPDFRG
jgi:ketosteroid isomerase-like protein